ncbi:tetratricopeptide repeat protein [Echinimonas agarilytica]|uniref:Tetratricopeptide repeat protein n=1 Tax=Echinimonas agarilytica TaxID=1215918 RepID=A0AA41W7P4_9GAMM|nr:tetratricopeptide repeat protein [Echinimonas agarilytica]MCM2680405.1 tetratricopeptide repeat protein [Echinimonas agarilytica]
MRTLLLIGWCVLSFACTSTNDGSIAERPIGLSELPLPVHRAGEDIPDAQQIFALSPEIKETLDHKFARYRHDPHDLMFAFRKWMTADDGFKVQYDNTTTYTATETFHERAGNCMSLALMTVAFADHLDLSADFLRPDVPLFWEQRDGIETIGDHVNVVVRENYQRPYVLGSNAFIVDFTPNNRYQFVKRMKLSRHEAITSFYSNRAAEALSLNQLDLAYSYAWHAIQTSPLDSGIYSLVGVVLRRQGQIDLAERSYRAGMQLDDVDPLLLHNLVYFLRFDERHYEAYLLSLKLEKIKLNSPFVMAREAQSFYEAGDYKQALETYNNAIQRANYIHDLHFGKARVLLALGEYEDAKAELNKAKELSTTRQQASQYSGKIAALNNLL